jgi:hypothetical protein
MFDTDEIKVLIAALNSLPIKGSDAAYIYFIQTKLKKEFDRIQKEFEAGPPELQDKKENKEPIKKQ